MKRWIWLADWCLQSGHGGCGVQTGRHRGNTSDGPPGLLPPPPPQHTHNREHSTCQKSIKLYKQYLFHRMSPFAMRMLVRCGVFATSRPNRAARPVPRNRYPSNQTFLGLHKEEKPEEERKASITYDNNVANDIFCCSQIVF